MLVTIVASTERAPGPVSSRLRRAKPSLTSGGSTLSARMYSCLAVSSTAARSIFISLHRKLAVLHDRRPLLRFFVDGLRELGRRGGRRCHTLHREPGLDV